MPTSGNTEDHVSMSMAAALARAHDFMRAHVPVLVDDRPPSPDLRKIAELIASGGIERACGMNVN